MRSPHYGRWVLVSPDALIQADAMMIVGIIFFVNLRQAMGLRVTLSFFRRLSLPIGLFSLSAMVAILETWPPVPGLVNIVTPSARVLFVAGLFSPLYIAATIEKELVTRS